MSFPYDYHRLQLYTGENIDGGHFTRSVVLRGELKKYMGRVKESKKMSQLLASQACGEAGDRTNLKTPVLEATQFHKNN